MVAAGKARLMARKPSWGYLPVYDAETGEQAAKFDRASNVHTLLPRKARGASTTPRYWANARTALGIRTASSPSTSASWAKEAVQLRMVGQFVPDAPASTRPTPDVWGVAIRSDGVIFASDMGSGLWIVKAKG